MKMEIVFARKEKKKIRAIILLKGDKSENIDSKFAVVFEGKDKESIFIPQQQQQNHYTDPVYPSDGENYVTRVEKGIYQACSNFSFDIKKMHVLAKINDKRISKTSLI